jgi:hypothetical protein
MALRQALEDVLTQVATIQVETADRVQTTLHTRVWNNQVERLRAGTSQVYQMPCALVETITDTGQARPIGGGYYSIPIVFRVHILNMHLNTEGSFEQDLTIYALRDAVASKLNRFKPDACGFLALSMETPDFDHDALYHYSMDFETELIDSSGSDDDTSTGVFIQSPAPLDLIIEDEDENQINPHAPLDLIIEDEDENQINPHA